MQSSTSNIERKPRPKKSRWECKRKEREPRTSRRARNRSPKVDLALNLAGA